VSRGSRNERREVVQIFDVQGRRVDAMVVEMLVLHSNNESSRLNQRMRLSLLLEESKKFYVKSFKDDVASRDKKALLGKPRLLTPVT
jgi:hypothetical protein